MDNPPLRIWTGEKRTTKYYFWREMRGKFNRVLIWMFVGVFASQSFLVIGAMADNTTSTTTSPTPTPTSNWWFKKEDGAINIKLYYKSVTDGTTVREFSQNIVASGSGFDFYKVYNGQLTKLYSDVYTWNLSGVNYPQVNVMTTDTNFSGLESAGVVFAVCFPNDTDLLTGGGQLPASNQYQTRPPNGVSGTTTSFACLSKDSISNETAFNSWVNQNLQDYFDNKDNEFVVSKIDPEKMKANITAIYKAILSGKTEITMAGRSSAPATENITACAKYATKPMFYNNDNAKTGLGNMFDATFKELSEDPANKVAIDWLTKYFVTDKDKNVDKIISNLSDYDKQAYEKYYGEIGKEYPTVPPTRNLYLDLVALYSSLQNEFPDGEIKNTEFSRFMSAFTISTLSLGVMGAGLSGVSVLNKLINNFSISHDLGQTFISYFKFALPAGYLAMNASFNQCLANNNDPYAIVDPQLTEMISYLKSDALSNLSSNLTSENDEACAKRADGSPAGIILKAFCELAVILKGWADSFYNKGMEWMTASIGMVINNNGTETDSPTGDAAAGPPGTTSEDFGSTTGSTTPSSTGNR